MSSRVERLAAHLQAPAPASAGLAPAPTHAATQPTTFGKVGTKAPTDVVIVAAVRTAVGKASKGSFKDTTPDELLKPVLEAVLKRPGVDPALVKDVVCGNVQIYGSYVTAGRAAQIRAGIPVESGWRTVNRQCSSGLQAVADVALAIAAGVIDCGIGAGVEHMSSGGAPGNPETLGPCNLGAIFEHPVAKETLTAMGITSENVAEKYSISRERQDKMAVESHAKALKAQKAGLFKDEIVPVTVTVTDKEGKEKEVTVSADEGPKEGTTLEVLSKLKPAFKKGGSTTAGNASQVSDGAAAVLLMRRDLADKLKLPILGVFRGFKVVGCDPSIMGIGPALAIPALLKDVGLSVDAVDVYEINEAFASQASYTQDLLKIPSEKLNPLGGAIALGHPLGCTGARQTATLLHQMKRTGKKLGVVSMCIGGGQGAAALYEGA